MIAARFQTSIWLPVLINNDFVDNLSTLKEQLPHRTLIILVFTWWGMWFHINKVIFDEIDFSERKAIQIIQNTFTEFISLENLDRQDNEGINTSRYKMKRSNQQKRPRE